MEERILAVSVISSDSVQRCICLISNSNLKDFVCLSSTEKYVCKLIETHLYSAANYSVRSVQSEITLTVPFNSF